MGQRAFLLRYVAIYNLHKAAVPTFGIQIEGLRLNGRGLHDRPFEVALGRLGEGWVARVGPHWLNGLGAILRLLGAGNAGQPVRLLVHRRRQGCT